MQARRTRPATWWVTLTAGTAIGASSMMMQAAAVAALHGAGAGVDTAIAHWQFGACVKHRLTTVRFDHRARHVNWLLKVLSDRRSECSVMRADRALSSLLNYVGDDHDFCSVRDTVALEQGQAGRSEDTATSTRRMGPSARVCSFKNECETLHCLTLASTQAARL